MSLFMSIVSQSLTLTHHSQTVALSFASTLLCLRIHILDVMFSCVRDYKVSNFIEICISCIINLCFLCRTHSNFRPGSCCSDP